jgi:hypothetical protein
MESVVKLYVPDANDLSKSASGGTFIDCHKSRNSENMLFAPQFLTTKMVLLTLFYKYTMSRLTTRTRLELIPKHHPHLLILRRACHIHLALRFQLFYCLWRLLP